MAYNLELRVDTRSDNYTQKGISADTAFADPTVIPVGYFTDFGLWLVGFIPAESYIMRLVMVVVGIVILGFGVSLSVSANVIMNSGEAFVKAIADTANKNFGNVKIAFDVSCVVLALILSLLLFDSTIVGTREGTVISALCTGLAVKLFQRLTNEPVNRLVSD